MLSVRVVAGQAHLRSHSVANASAALANAPTASKYTIRLYLFRVLLLEKLQLPLCGFGNKVQRMPSAFRRSGTLQSIVHCFGQNPQGGVTPVEGARVRSNAFFKDITSMSAQRKTH